MMHEVPDRKAAERIARPWQGSGKIRELVLWFRKAAAERDTDSRWYVVRTRRDDSEEVAALLGRHGVEAWCPMKKAVKRLPRRRDKVTVMEPLFPRYFFVRLVDFEAAFLGVMTFDGVDCLLGHGEKPTPVPERIIAKIQEDGEGGRIDTSALFHRGDKALVLRGPFASFEGIVTEEEGRGHAIDVEIEIFGRMTPCRIGIDDLKKLA